MPRRLLAPLVLLALAGCGKAEPARPPAPPPGAERHPAPTVPGQTMRADLDGDPGQEELVIERVGAQVRLALRDRCAGTTASWPLAPPADGIVRRDAIRLDGPGSPRTVAVETRAGAAGAAGYAAVLSYHACRAPVPLFAYASIDPRPRPPANLRVVDFDFAVDGSRLRLTEALAGPQEAQCCPSSRRISVYRLPAGGRRYVRVSSRVER